MPEKILIYIWPHLLPFHAAANNPLRAKIKIVMCAKRINFYEFKWISSDERRSVTWDLLKIIPN